jgi:hypothetical protein
MLTMLSVSGPYRVSHEVILSKKVYMYMCPIPDGFRDRAVSLYRRATRHVLTRVAKCTDGDGGILETGKHYQLCHLNTKYRYKKQHVISSLSTNVGTVQWTLNPFGIGQMYRVFSAQAGWTLTQARHKDTEQNTIEASITLDGLTLTDPLISWSPNEWPSVCREIPQCLPISCSGRLIRLQNEHPICTHFCLEWPILWPPGILTSPPETPCIAWMVG